MVAAEGRRQERLNKVREDLERKEVEECTFAPEITTGGGLNPSTTYERTMQWAKRRDEKLALERSQQQKMETDFSFAPETAEGGYDNSAAGFVPAGFDAFVIRQESARERRHQEPQPGQWTPQRTTVPEEFHLGTGQGGGIHSLNKPLPAPMHTPQAAVVTPATSAYAAPTPHVDAPRNDIAYNLASNLINQDRDRYSGYGQPHHQQQQQRYETPRAEEDDYFVD
jgi:hypothetical protein